eukprot:g17355.t2
MQDTTAWDTEEQGWALLPCLPHPAMRMSVKHVGRFIPVKSSDDSSYKDGKGFWETKDVQMGNRLSKMKFKSRGKAQTFISSGKASRRAFDTLASDHNSGLIDWHESEGGVAETRRLEEAKNEHEEEEVEGQKDQEDQEDQEEEHKEEEEDEGDERHGDGSEKAREKIGRQSTVSVGNEAGTSTALKPRHDYSGLSQQVLVDITPRPHDQGSVRPHRSFRGGHGGGRHRDTRGNEVGGKFTWPGKPRGGHINREQAAAGRGSPGGCLYVQRTVGRTRAPSVPGRLRGGLEPGIGGTERAVVHIVSGAPAGVARFLQGVQRRPDLLR